MLRWLVSLVFLLTVTALPAQTVFGIVRDSSTHETIPYCSILVKGTTTGTTCDDQGAFHISLDQLPATLVIRSVGYTTREITVTNAGTALRVALMPQTYFMKEVVIGAQVPTCIQTNKAAMAADFEFYDNFLLLLSYRDLKTGELSLIDANGNPYSTLLVSGKMETLYRDCFGKLHVQSKDSSWQVYYDYEKLQLLDPVSIQDFEATVKPAELFYKGHLYLHLYSYHQQRCTYVAASEGKMSKFYYTSDTNGVQYIQRKYDIRFFLAKRKMGEEYLYSVHYIKTHLDQLQAERIPDEEDRIFLHRLNAPLVLHKQAVWIFQFADNRAIRFNDRQQPVDTVPLTFHHEQGWQGTVLRDEITDELYSTFVSNGETKIIQLDGNTFKEGRYWMLSGYPFLSNLRIRNGIAYFLWRDTHGDGENRLLYRYPL